MPPCIPVTYRRSAAIDELESHGIGPFDDLDLGCALSEITRFLEADLQMDRVPELVCPCSSASRGHLRRIVTVRSKAESLAEGQPWTASSWPGSPPAKLVEADSQI
jgi:hypothetical protein